MIEEHWHDWRIYTGGIRCTICGATAATSASIVFSPAVRPEETTDAR